MRIEELPLGEKSEMTYLDLFDKEPNKVEFTIDFAEIRERQQEIRGQSQDLADNPIFSAYIKSILGSESFTLFIDASRHRAHKVVFKALPGLSGNEKSELIFLSLIPVLYRTALDSIKNFLRKSYADYKLYQATQNGISVPFHKYLKENKRALQTTFDKETQTWKSKPNLSEKQLAFCKLVAAYQNKYFTSLLVKTSMAETSMAENSSHLNPIRFAEALLPSEVEMRNTIIKLLEERVETHLQDHLHAEIIVNRMTTVGHVKNLLIASGYFYDGQFTSPLENIVVNASFERGINFREVILKIFQINRNNR